VSLEELAADKLLALFDRAQARDFLDVRALIERFGLA
jgi:predicted nucleotidyltransferase component of viral defense system